MSIAQLDKLGTNNNVSYTIDTDNRYIVVMALHIVIISRILKKIV